MDLAKPTYANSALGRHPYLFSLEEPHLSPIVWVNGFPQKFIRTGHRDPFEERKARTARQHRGAKLRKAA